jgi:hypothetical protein
MPTHAKKLVDLEPSLLVGVLTPSTAALLQATRSISMLRENFAKPGSNVTGFVNIEASLVGK